jgi:hypothetical protein
MQKGGNFLLQSGIIAATIAMLGNLWVEHQRNQAEFRLENLRHDSELIIESIDPHDVGATREMLTFLVDVGLIENPGNLEDLLNEPGDLPTSSGAIACYTREAGSDIRVVGFIEEIPGHYKGRIFIPKGYPDDISGEPYFKELCHEHLVDECPTEISCWAGGDTGGYYGFQ